jgi:hypothetical protein
MKKIQEIFFYLFQQNQIITYLNEIINIQNYENKRIAINHFEINGMINITPLKLLNKKICINFMVPYTRKLFQTIKGFYKLTYHVLFTLDHKAIEMVFPLKDLH